MDTQDKWTNNIFIHLFYPCLFEMDTQDKQSNNIFIQSFPPLPFFNEHKGQMDKQHTYLKHLTPGVFIMDMDKQIKQHIHSKDSTQVF